MNNKLKNKAEYQLKPSHSSKLNSIGETEEESTENTMLSEFEMQLKKQNELIKELNKSYKFMSDNFDALQKEIKQIKEDQKLIKKDISKLQVNEKSVQKKVISMEEQIAKIKQENNNNTMIITNMPKFKTEEDVIKVVKKIAQQVNYELNGDEIIESYQIDSKNKKSHPIIVKSKSNQFKSKCLNFRKEKKSIDMKKIDSKLSNNNNKNVNFFHFLEKEYVHLLGKAKEIAKEKQYKYVWYTNATVLMRKEEDSNIIKIRCEEDLQRIK